MSSPEDWRVRLAVVVALGDLRAAEYIEQVASLVCYCYYSVAIMNLTTTTTTATNKHNNTNNAHNAIIFINNVIWETSGPPST